MDRGNELRDRGKRSGTLEIEETDSIGYIRLSDQDSKETGCRRSPFMDPQGIVD